MKEELKQAKCRNLTAEKERLTKQIGLWSSADEITEQLSHIKGISNQRTAVKVQLQF